TSQTIRWLIRVLMRDLTDEFAMTGQARVLCNAAIEGGYANGFLKSAKGEGAAVIESVQGFNCILGKEGIVRRVTIVAGRHGVMRRAAPAVKFVAHDVAIRARAGI